MTRQDPSSVSRLINQSSRLLASLGDSRLRAHGFRYAQVPVLAALRDGDSVTQADLARRLGVEQSSMAQLLSRMERDGSIRRVPHESNARASRISVTRQALPRLPAARQSLLDLEAEALKGLEPNEIKTLTNLLARVRTNLERVATAAQTTSTSEMPT